MILSQNKTSWITVIHSNLFPENKKIGINQGGISNAFKAMKKEYSVRFLVLLSSTVD